MTPRSETLAFRVWHYCTPREWDCTVSEVAESLEESPARIRCVLAYKRWGGRLRAYRRWSRDPLGDFHGVGGCGLEMLDASVAW